MPSTYPPLLERMERRVKAYPPASRLKPFQLPTTPVATTAHPASYDAALDAAPALAPASPSAAMCLLVGSPSPPTSPLAPLPPPHCAVPCNPPPAMPCSRPSRRGLPQRPRPRPRLRRLPAPHDAARRVTCTLHTARQRSTATGRHPVGAPSHLRPPRGARCAAAAPHRSTNLAAPSVHPRPTPKRRPSCASSPPAPSATATSLTNSEHHGAYLSLSLISHLLLTNASVMDGADHMVDELPLQQFLLLTK